jgi:hypothetical protein
VGKWHCLIIVLYNCSVFYISQACGLSIVVVGIWARLQKAELGSIDNLSTDPAFFLLLLGLIMITISSFACFGALRENICLLKVVSDFHVDPQMYKLKLLCLQFQFSLSIVVVFLLEVIGGILTFVFLDRFQNHLIFYMRKAIEIYQDDKDLKNGLDYIQKTVEYWNF